MCLGKNSAYHATSYVKAQLEVLHKNAKECFNEVGEDLGALERYDFALAEFYASLEDRFNTGLKKNARFRATFGVPKLDFICNHEAVLTLDIASATELDVDGPFQVSCRVEFSVNEIRDQKSEVGRGSLLVFDLENAQVTSDKDINPIRDYLKKYLGFLQHTGQHVLFSLPNFNNDQDIIINYSLDALEIHNTDFKLDKVFKVSLEQINKQLKARWNEAANATNRRAKCLAYYQSNWTSLVCHADHAYQFHVDFEAPEVFKALCKREIVLFFKIKKIQIYDNMAKDDPYLEWRIAVVVDIQEVNNTIKLDAKTLRFCERHSKFSDEATMSTSFAVQFKPTFIEFIVEYYAAVLEHAGIYVPEVTKPERPSNMNEINEFEEKPVGMEEIVRKSNMHRFDFIQVISQYTIIEHFKNLWDQARDSKNNSLPQLYRWFHNENFNCTFSPFRLQILPNEKAIIYIDLSGGSFKPLESTTEVDVSGWILAFEVGFALFKQEDVSKAWLSRFKKSVAWEKHGDKDDRTLKHLGLDFSNPDFIYEQSKFGKQAFTYVMRAVHYFTDYYFPHLVQNGCNILHSIPVWTTGSKPPNMGLTAVDVQTYSGYDQQELAYRHLPFKAAIVLLGMTGFHDLPPKPLPYSTDLTQGNTAYGTVIISKKRFLEERLLTLLAQVNTTSTVVPIFPGADNLDSYASVTTKGGHVLALTTWARRGRNGTGSDCRWKPEKGSETLRKWSHRDVWSYNHEDAVNNHNNNQHYIVKCVTENDLSLSGGLRQDGIDIKLSGKVTIQLNSKELRQKSDENLKVTASWSVTISLQTKPGGGGITVGVKNDPPSPGMRDEGAETSTAELNNLDKLRDLLEMDLSHLTSELEQTFGETWEHCFPGTGAYSLNNPIFNEHGDIIFELRPYDPSSASSAPAPKSRPSVTAEWVTSFVDQKPNGLLAKEGISPRARLSNTPSLHGNGDVTPKVLSSSRALTPQLTMKDTAQVEQTAR